MGCSRALNQYCKDIPGLSQPLLHRSCEAEISQLRADLNTALDMVLQHRVYIDGRLRAVTAAVQETHKELAAMPVPARSSKS
jgi:hypothetical protein